MMDLTEFEDRNYQDYHGYRQEPRYSGTIFITKEIREAVTLDYGFGKYKDAIQDMLQKYAEMRLQNKETN